MVLNIQVSVPTGVVTFDILDDSAANGIIALGNKGLVSRLNNNYQVFGQNNGDLYVRIDTREYSTAGFGKITVTQTIDTTVTKRTINLKVINSLSDYTALSDLPITNVFKNTFYRVAPIKSEQFTGNNLQVTITPNPNNFFLIRFADKLNVTFTYSSNMTKKLFADQKAGKNVEVWWLEYNFGLMLDIDTNIVYYFNCNQDFFGGSTSCKVSDTIFYEIEMDQSLIYATYNDFVPETGIILATSNSKDKANFVYLGIEFPDDIWVKTVNEKVLPGKVFFKITQKLYSVFIIHEDRINIYQSWNKEITAMQDKPREVIMSGDGQLIPKNVPFCPTSITVCPLKENIIHVDSRCSLANQRFSFSTLYDSGLLLVDRSEFNQNEFGFNADPQASTIRTCHMCLESIIVNLGSANLYSMKPSKYQTALDLKAAEVGYVSITALHCVRGIQAAVIEGLDKDGKTLMSIIRGNVIEDSRSRWVYTGQIEGSISQVAPAKPTGVMVSVLNKDKSNSVYLAWLNGPIVTYGQGELEGSQFELSISTKDGKGKDSKKFTFNYLTPEDSLSLKEGSTLSPKQGFYNINDIAQFDGPLFSMSTGTASSSVNKNRMLKSESDELEADAKFLTTNPPFTEVFKYVNPSGGMNLVEPQLIYSASNTVGNQYQVGVRTSSVSTILYYYGDTANFWFVEDTGYKCDAFDVDFSNNNKDSKNTALLFAGVCEEGGELWLRYFVKGMTSGSNKNGISGLKTGEWNVSVSNMGKTTNELPMFLITAVITGGGQMRYWTVTLKLDENQNFDFDTVTEGNTITGVDRVGTFNYQGSKSYGVIVYTGFQDNTIHSVLVDQNATATQLTDVTLPTNELLYKFNCNTFNNQGNCIVIQIGSVLYDLTFDVDEDNLKLTASNIKTYKYFDGFLPTYTTFNEKLLLVKGYRRSGTINEVVMVYDRTSGNNYLKWGMQPADYYNNVNKGNATPCLPLVAKIDGITNVYFTQYLMTYEEKPTTSPFRIFSYTGNLQLSINADLDSNQARNLSLVFNDASLETKNNLAVVIKINDLFNGETPMPSSGTSSGSSSGTSETPGKTVYWWIWVIIGILVLIVLILSLKVADLSNGSKSGRYKNDATTDGDDAATINNQSGVDTQLNAKNDDAY